MNFKVERADSCDKINFKKICAWMHEWWGKEEGFSLKWVEHFMQHSFNKDRLPVTVLAYNNDEVVAIAQLSMHDLDVRPDIYPYACNVFVDPNYRGNGLVKLLMEKLFVEAKRLKIKELYLYTQHVGLYEKYGWQFVGTIDTFKKPSLQRLYHIKL